MDKDENVSPENCPLCGQSNNCGNLSSGESKTCWCADKAVTFSKELLNQVSKKDKNKACICKTCALRFKDGDSSSTS